MNESFVFDVELREALAAGPRVAPASVLEGAFRASHGRQQRRPRFGWLDGRAWPPPRASIADPAVRRSAQVLLVLALLAAALATSIAIGARLQDKTRTWSFENAGALAAGYGETVAVGLPDGRILVGGLGSTDGRLVEVFDPASGRSTSIVDTAPGLTLQRAALMGDGRVLLICWRYTEPMNLGRSFGRVFDPATDTLGPPIDMAPNRFEPGVATLADGRVSISGGVENPEDGNVLDTVEVFDPATDTFAPAGSMGQGRFEHAVTALADGRLLMSFGVVVPQVPGTAVPVFAVDASTPGQRDLLLFDPGSGMARSVARLPDDVSTRVPEDPVGLPDGRVVVFGGQQMFCGEHGNRPVEAFLFDPVDASLTRIADVPHTVRTALALSDGTILVTGSWDATVGGCSGSGREFTDAWVGIYDPADGSFRQTPDPMTGAAGLPFDTDATYRASVLIPDGRVALIDEASDGARPNVVDIVEIGP